MSKLVTVYPSIHGLFFDGIPAVEQQVTEKVAEEWCRHGVFTRERPDPPPEAASTEPKGPPEGGPPDSTEV